MTQGSTGLLGLATAILVATDTITIELLFMVGLIQGTVMSLGTPARTPLMAQVVGKDQVLSATSRCRTPP
ncbi:MAG TPA: hypothetical protein QGF35_02905 [Dehalococcoidia bacterium]|nr:hypothetical protein [Dehalococcoidia bacterium]